MVWPRQARRRQAARWPRGILPERLHYDRAPARRRAAAEDGRDLGEDVHMTWIVGLALVVLLGYGVWIYNRLVHDRNLVSQGFADIDVQLKRRADLVPRLVETVRGYATHERATLEAATELRARVAALAAQAGGPDAARFAAESGLGAALQRLVVLQESYPSLKADAGFRDLAAKLVEVEDHLQYARRFYNGAVKQYVTRLQSFPDLLLAQAFGFEPAAFFETDDRASVAVRP
jgi:LemA protein